MEVFDLKKRFMKMVIQSRQLKRVIMILMSKNPLPTDVSEMSDLIQEFSETVSWKVMTKVDEIELHKKKMAE